MKQSQAKELIRAEYLRWKNNPANENSSDPKFQFFLWLQQNRPDLLDFRYSGSDKWQCVYCMLSGL